MCDYEIKQVLFIFTTREPLANRKDLPAPNSAGPPPVIPRIWTPLLYYTSITDYVSMRQPLK